MLLVGGVDEHGSECHVLVDEQEDVADDDESVAVVSWSPYLVGVEWCGDEVAWPGCVARSLGFFACGGEHECAEVATCFHWSAWPVSWWRWLGVRS